MPRPHQVQVYRGACRQTGISSVTSGAGGDGGSGKVVVIVGDV